MPPLPAEAGFLETVALGLLQGPAELLPISSSAHVELLPWLLGFRHARLDGARRKEVAVALHGGTALALLALKGPPARERMGFLAVATAPAAVAGLALERAIEQRLGTPRDIACGLLGGSVALLASDRAGSRRTAHEAGMGDALALGLAQAAALVPGISRSGATRSMARGRGFSRPAAISLSEDAALPVLVGATVLKGARLAGRRPPRRALAALAGGAAAAAGSSALALRSRRAAAVPPSAWAAYRTGLAIGALWAARSDRGLRETDGR